MTQPLVSVLVVVRNEKEHVRQCIDSILQQDYPSGCLEMLFVDGCSEDGTEAFLEREVAELARKGRLARLLVNRKRVLASGWNIGIREAQGEFVCRIDAHCQIGPSYISNGIQCLLQPGNEAVAAAGGWWTHAGMTPIGRSIAALLSSKFAVGNSPFRRRPTTVCQTDTAVYAVYRRSVFTAVGHFDESLARNQDMVMHHRIKAAGYTLLTHPAMEITYYVRSTVGRLIEKAFGDGKWVALAGREYFCLRHSMPFFFVLYLGSLVLTMAANSLWLEFPYEKIVMALALLPITGYGVLALLFAFAAPCAPVVRMKLVPLFFVFHVAYGVGTLWGYALVWTRVPRVLRGRVPG